MKQSSKLKVQSSKFISCCLLLTAYCLLAVDSWAVVHPSKLKFKPLEFNPPSSEVVLLNNGIILHMIEDHELPTIDMTAVIRTGSVYEPEDKIGLAGVAGAVMRTGGANPMQRERIYGTLYFM